MYQRDEVEVLASYIWDDLACWGVTVREGPEPGMPRAAAERNHLGTPWALLADIKRAYRCTALTLKQRRAVLLIGGLHLHPTAAAIFEDTSRQSITQHWDSAISAMTQYLNGE